MRILFLNQFYWPDTAATGQLLADLTDHLGRAGEEITVICGSPDYGGPSTGLRPQARIVRLKNVAFSRRVAGRMGSYLSFLGGALWQSLRIEAPDVVVTLTTPPLVSLIGLTLQRFRGARHVIWEMDVYPDIAVDLGVLKAGGFLARIFGWLADLPRRRADRIVVLGECMRARLLAHGIPPEKIVIAHNWADDPALRDHFPSSGPLSIIYSGNFGLAHDVETVAGALADLDRKNEKDIHFVFAGAGSRNAWLQDFCTAHRIGTARFLPYCERAALPARIAASHIGLLTQKAECCGSVVPSKIYGIMAAGRPVLFIGPRNATPARLIAEHHCGWQIECGDVGALVSLLHTLNADRSLLHTAGAKARHAFLAHYQRKIGVTRIAELLVVQPAPAEAVDFQPLAPV